VDLGQGPYPMEERKSGGRAPRAWRFFTFLMSNNPFAGKTQIPSLKWQPFETNKNLGSSGKQ